MLHLVDDQHHTGLGLFHDGGNGLRQRGAVFLAQAVEREAELEAQRAHLGALHARQGLAHARALVLQLGQRLLYGGMHQRSGRGLHIAPQVHIDHQRTHGLQRGNEVVLQEGGLAGAALAGEEQAGLQGRIQRAGAQQLCGHLAAKVGARVDAGHGDLPKIMKFE